MVVDNLEMAHCGACETTFEDLVHHLNSGGVVISIDGLTAAFWLINASCSEIHIKTHDQ